MSRIARPGSECDRCVQVMIAWAWPISGPMASWRTMPHLPPYPWADPVLYRNDFNHVCYGNPSERATTRSGGIFSAAQWPQGMTSQESREHWPRDRSLIQFRGMEVSPSNVDRCADPNLQAQPQEASTTDPRMRTKTHDISGCLQKMEVQVIRHRTFRIIFFFF